MTFKHAGDCGDVIYSLPVIRAIGGGTLCLHAEKWTRERMNDRKVKELEALLTTLPYIDDVRWLNPGEQVDVNLNDFRAAYFRTFKHPDFPKQRNLCEWILRTHDVDPVEQYKKWLTVRKPIRAAKVIINRTPRYQNPHFPWAQVIDQYRGEIGFVGTMIEHAGFTKQFGDVPHVETPTLLTLARVIAGAELFIGNQSLPYAIAEGLKKPAVLEVCQWLPNCLFNRPDCFHGWGTDVQLPALDVGGPEISGESLAGSSRMTASPASGQSSAPAKSKSKQK